MQTSIASLQTLLLLSLATSVATAATDAAANDKKTQTAAVESRPSATINSGAAARRQRELEARSMKALVRQSVAAVGDLQSACPGGPRPPKLDLKGPGDLQSLGSTPSLIGITQGNNVSGNWACEPHWNHLLYSAAHALLATSSWVARNPQMAHLVRITPKSPDELKQLQTGLATVMAAFDVPVKP